MKYFILLISIILLGCSTSKQRRIIQEKSGKNITNLFQKLVDVSKPGDTIFLANREYWVDHEIFIYGKSGLVIQGDQTTIKMLDGTPVNKSKSIFDIYNCSGIQIYDLVLDANRSNRKPKEVPCHTVSIINSNDIHFENVQSINSVVDGFYIAASDPRIIENIPRNLVFKDCKAYNAFRNGMSIINGYNIHIIEGEYSFSNGTPPMAGIDVEANLLEPSPGSKDITIENVIFRSNGGWGILVSHKGTPEAINLYENQIESGYGGIKHTAINSEIRGNKINDVENGLFSIRYGGNPIDRNIVSENHISNAKIGIRYTGFDGQIINNTIIDCETGIELNGNTTDNTRVNCVNNTIKDFSEIGIYARNFNDSNISNNKLNGNGKEGLRLYNGKHVVAKNRVSGKLGINAANSDCIIENNLFDNDVKKPISIRDSSLGLSKGIVNKNIFENGQNIIVQNKSKYVELRQ